MQRIKLTLAYVGTHFSGWQAQEHTHMPQPRTVQAELEKALQAVIGQPARLHGSGRTDAGVHADMQVAHFDAPDNLARVNWPAALQRKLPGDIVILAAEPVPQNFHARFNATGKIYVYSLWLSHAPLPPRLAPFAWACGTLDISLMEQAAALLTGTHDFAAFQNTGAEIKETTRTLRHIRHYALALPLQEASTLLQTAGITMRPQAAEMAWPMQTPGSVLPADSPLQAWEFYGDGFLKQMVRNLIGFLVAVGQGKLQPQDVLALLKDKNRAALPFATAPACGLTLKNVLY